MSIRFHDSRLRTVVELDTRDPGRVSMYVCGPTVYNLIHIGNARTFLWFDFIRQYFAYRGLQVTYVMNYTDVDDKIIERAKVEGSTSDAVTAKYTRAFEDDMAALGVTPADVLSRATDHIGDMVKAIEGLIERGVAYSTGGDVFYSVEKFSGYGKLSGRSLEDMRAGDRVDPHEGKSHPLDFALWKAAKKDEPSWPSPWGPGRPGWHIECSVMSAKYLGMGFDIHGGASDLIFPHHENEIAQAEALAESEPFVRHWLHAGLVQMESVKMSKSLGNVVLAREVVAAYPGEVARYWALTGSYRTQLSFSDEALADAAQGYERWSTFLAAAKHALGPDMPPAPQLLRRPEGADGLVGPGAEYIGRFIEALDDDFNSSQAFAVVHELVREANRRIEPAQRGETEDREVLASLAEAFAEMTTMMGFSFGPMESPKLVDDLVEYLLELRDVARREKEFERADAIRSRLTAMGVAIEDTPAGARWRLTPVPREGG
ncbi:MAG: cysteine--tRNA ligase [Actinomycetota bacterium]|nr:cysteine--tRNA ligase [Actinomycetota bacterium]